MKKDRKTIITGLGMSAVAAAMIHRLQEGVVFTELSEKEVTPEMMAAISEEDEVRRHLKRIADRDLSEIEVRAALGTVSNAVPDSDSHAKAKLEVMTEAMKTWDADATAAEKKAWLANLTAEMERVVIDNRRQQNAPTRHAQTKEAARRLRQMERRKK